MTDLRQAAQQALEAWFRPHGINYVDFKPYMEALRAALAEPEQEPVAWEQFYPDIGKPQTTHWEGCEAVHPECRTEQEPDGISWLKRDSGYFTAPTPRKPLTEPELHAINPTWPAPGQEWGYEEVLAFARAIERAHGIGE